MSAAVTILVDEKKNVLKIPIQTVLGLRGKRLCFVKRDEGFAPRELVLGVSNDTYVEVKEGLKGRRGGGAESARPAGPRANSRLGLPRRTGLLVRSVNPTRRTDPSAVLSAMA